MLIVSLSIRARWENQFHFFDLSNIFSNVELTFKMGLFSSIFRSEDSLLCKIALFVLATFTFFNQGQKWSKMKIVKKRYQKWQKWNERPQTCFLGNDWIVQVVVVSFCCPSIWPFLPKVPELGPQKKALPPVPVQKNRDHFYNLNFPQKLGLQPLISFFVTFECVFWGCSFSSSFGSDVRR